MLTKELLTANAVLNTLTDEQIDAIVTLSSNDENTVIGNRFGEVYRTFDENIFKASGISRNGDEKTYNYLDRVIVELVSKGKDAEKRVNELTKEKERLEKAIADGSADAEAKKALLQAQKDLASVTKQYNDLKGEYDKMESTHNAELFGLKIDTEIANARQGLKLKASIPASAMDVIVNNAIAKVKGMNPEYIDNGNGGKVLAFKDGNGAILRNPENQLNPYTANDLLTRELKQMGVLDEGIKQEGGGTTPPARMVGEGSPAVDISGARTRTEAYDMITSQLLSQGMTKGSNDFENAMNQAWKDNNIASLPMQ